MRSRTTWQLCVLVLTLLSVLTCVATQEVGRLLLVTVGVAVIAGIAAWTVADAMEVGPVGPGGRGLLWGAVAGAALAGWVPMLGGWGWVLVLAGAATHPALVAAGTRTAMRSRRRRTGAPRGARLDTLSDGDLRDRWEMTGRRMRHPSCSSPIALAALVEERARILDEVESRDPGGFDRWISATGSWGGAL